MVQPGGTAVRYGIGVCRDGVAWSGVHSNQAKREWHDWTPPREIAPRPDRSAQLHGKAGESRTDRASAIYPDRRYRIHGSQRAGDDRTSGIGGLLRMQRGRGRSLGRVSVGTHGGRKN